MTQHTLSRAKFDAICEAVSHGALSAHACKDNGISTATLYRWCDSSDELRGLYARARVLQCHALADECVAIADGTDAEAQQRLAAMAESVSGADDDDKDRLLNSLQQAAIGRDRLRLDARKWLTSKIAPRIYGERTQVDVKHRLDDSLTTLLAGAFTGTAPLSIVEAGPIRVIEQPLAAPDDNT